MPILSTENWLNYYSTLMGKSLQTATVQIPMSADTRLTSSSATTNFSTGTDLRVGEDNNNTNFVNRSIIVPDFSLIPIDVTFVSSILKMTPVTDVSSSDRTMYAHRILRAVNVSQSTWNIFSSGNNWGTGGCSNSTTDYDGAVIMGSATQPASPTLNSALSFEMPLDASELQKLHDGTYTNNGIVLFVDTQLNDSIRYASMEHATADYRPVIEITYEWFG